MEANGVWKGGFETRLEDGRGHVVIVDLPTDAGGGDAGTSPLELTALSLAGCITTIFAMIAAKRKLAFEGLHVSLSADRPPGAPTIRKVHGTLEVRTEASKADVETVLRLTLKTCPVGVLFERAQIPVEIALSISPTTVMRLQHFPGHTGPEPT